MRKLFLALLVVVALCAQVCGQARAQTLETIYRFNRNTGWAPIWKPVADGQGNLYGTTENGGTKFRGTIYKFTPATRAFETLYTFTGGADGQYPQVGLTYDKNSNVLYGTTYGGLTLNCPVDGIYCGTIFSLNPATGAFTTLYTFPGGEDQQNPLAPLTLGSDGVLYGTTAGYGTLEQCLQTNSCGTAFKFDPSTGALTTLHVFSWTDGAFPQEAPLVFGKAGKLFGVTPFGGRNGAGVVFRIDPATNAFDVIYDLPASASGLAVDPNKNLYVTAEVGGAYGQGAIIKLVPNVGESYTVSTLFSFGQTADTGIEPLGSLGFDKSRNVLYGTASGGGAGGLGTLYEVDPNSGAFTLLHSFTGGSDGETPQDGILISLGQLYGGASGSLTPQGCLSSCGTLFKYPRF